MEETPSPTVIAMKNPFETITPQMVDETQLNQAIISTDAKAALISIPLPEYKQTKIVILKRNEKTGEPELKEDGTNVLLEGEITEFIGWKEKLIEFPIPEVFSNDLVKAYLVDDEVNFVRVAQHSYIYFLQEYFATQNEDYLPLLHLTAGLVASVNNTSRGRHGFAVTMAKKKISVSQGDDLGKLKAEEQIKKQGFLNRILPFGGGQKK